MARSHSIYVVQDEYDKVLACFTVKHEMQTWARRRRDDLTYVSQPFKVLRFRDDCRYQHIGVASSSSYLTPEEIFGRE